MSQDVKINWFNPAEGLRVLASILTDLGVLRTPTNALVTDYTAGRAEVVKLFADVTALRAAVVAITAKLDADAGVTDVNYASTCDPAAITAAAPAAVTAVAGAALNTVDA